uniref:Uncharacterized protein n=1 Tax=Elaeophora elaphi TaxID=1147741 RepID=A0A0R3RG42_9BILA
LIDFFFSAIQQQKGSLGGSRTFIISDPQHCSVSATLSLNRPKKLFISKEKITEKSTAAATFQASPTTNTQNLNNSKGISTLSHNKIDQKSPIVNFETKAISPPGSHHFRDSTSTNNDNISSQKSSKIIPFYSTPIENVAAVSVAKSSDTNSLPEVILDIPRPDSPHSTINSRESGGCRGDCSLVNSLHSSAEYKDGMNQRQNNINECRQSLSSRLSRGFLEFTQGSSDRLQKWKNKLQNGRRHKDSSEPPPMNRSIL